ncbi:MAG: hypothetical protein U0575_09020 [Phycisphaerales bacterium]
MDRRLDPVAGERIAASTGHVVEAAPRCAISPPESVAAAEVHRCVHRPLRRLARSVPHGREGCCRHEGSERLECVMDATQAPDKSERSTPEMRMTGNRWSGRALCAVLLAVAGCSAPPINPSFPLTEGDANKSIAQMTESPQPLERPLVVLGGYLDPGVAADQILEVVKPTTTGGPVFKVAFGGCHTFDECRERVIAAVLEALPDRSSAGAGRFETMEVDVVTNSMGGLVRAMRAGRSHRRPPCRHPAPDRALDDNLGPSPRP